jgi:hypothetical protein
MSVDLMNVDGSGQWLRMAITVSTLLVSVAAPPTQPSSQLPNHHHMSWTQKDAFFCWAAQCFEYASEPSVCCLKG